MGSFRKVLGLALAFFAFTPLAIAQSPTPDMILTGGKIITVDAADTIAEALAITHGRISAVGSTAQVRALAGPQTVMVDLAGRTAIPGLIDSHIHAIRDALYYTTLVDWGDISDLNGALASIRTARTNPGLGPGLPWWVGGPRTSCGKSGHPLRRNSMRRRPTTLFSSSIFSILPSSTLWP